MRVFLSILIVIITGWPLFTAGNVPMLFFGEAKQYARGGLTASGERFEGGSLAGAHKTLPFGSLVRVTNLENDKHVTVRINDRTADNSATVLNLTRAAAVLLGFQPERNAKVEVQVIKVGAAGASSAVKQQPAPVQRSRNGVPAVQTNTVRAFKDLAPASANNGNAAGQYRLQVAAFRKRENVEAFVLKLRGLGYRVTVSTQSSGFHRVLVGPFPNRKAAVSAQSALSGEAPAAFIRKE